MNNTDDNKKVVQKSKEVCNHSRNMSETSVINQTSIVQEDPQIKFKEGITQNRSEEAKQLQNRYGIWTENREGS